MIACTHKYLSRVLVITKYFPNYYIFFKAMKLTEPQSNGLTNGDVTTNGDSTSNGDHDSEQDHEWTVRHNYILKFLSNVIFYLILCYWC